MQQYQISIITPYHNVDSKLFNNCCDSLFKQSYGFENIEWIVVVHNSDQEHLDEVLKKVGQHQNVKIEILNNERRTPSSPRNYGMKLATGKYIAFLDGDDMLTPYGIEKGLEQAEVYQAEITALRRSYVLENEGLSVSPDFFAWNQTLDVVIMDENHHDEENMYSGVALLIHGKLILREFLRKHDIKFDETVPYAEDILFGVECLSRANKVCYLPQIIGWIYCINANSLVQSQGKSSEVLISYAQGFKTVFDTMLTRGIYADSIIVLCIFSLSLFMIESTSLTTEERQQIKEILEPYIAMTSKLPPSKIVSEDETTYIYEMTREVILHPELFANGYFMKSFMNDQENMIKIIKEHKDTDFGERYHFKDILTLEGYRYRVPLTSYKTYEPFVELQAKAGEHGIFVKHPITHYLLTSGTGEDHRMLLPSTAEHQQAYNAIFRDVISNKKTFLLAESLPIGQRCNDGAFLNTITGVVLSNFYMQINNSFSEIGDYFTSPIEVLFPKTAINTTYYRLLFALADPEVEQIVAPFTWGVYEILCSLERNWESLCDNIEHGTIDFTNDIPEIYRKKLRHKLIANPERAKQLREIFRTGFDTPVLKKVWTKFERIVAGGSGSFQIYTDRMKRYTGDVVHDNGYYLCSEGVIGKALPDSHQYELITDVNFYEFIPADKQETEAVLVRQLEEGKEYELVITSTAGLYRYCTGDIIKIKSTDSKRVVFEPVCKKAHKKLGITEQDIYQSIKLVEEKYHIIADDFAFMIDDAEKKVVIFLETPEFVKNNHQVGKNAVEAYIGEALASISKHYKNAVARGELCGCAVYYIQPQTHLLYRDRERFNQKTAPDQIKPVRFIDTLSKEKLFKAMVEQGE